MGGFLERRSQTMLPPVETTYLRIGRFGHRYAWPTQASSLVARRDRLLRYAFPQAFPEPEFLDDHLLVSMLITLDCQGYWPG